MLHGWWNHCSGSSQAGENEMINAIREMERLWGPEHSECLGAKRSLAHSYRGSNAEGAQRILAEILPMHVERFGPIHPVSRRLAEDLRSARERIWIGSVSAQADQVLFDYQQELNSVERQGVPMLRTTTM